MADSGAPAAGERRWRLQRRWAAALWLVFGGILWLVVFDASIAREARAYLTRQALYTEGRGPSGSLQGAMDAAAAEGVRRATTAAGTAWAAGLAGIWMATRRRAALLR